PRSVAMIEVDDLTVRYGRTVALRDVNVRVRRGEIIGVVGPNGAGKTTLMKTIAGVMRPAAGQIRLAGNVINDEAPERIVRAGLALVPEGRHVFPRLTVAENLQVGTAGRNDMDGVDDDLRLVHDLF